MRKTTLLAIAAAAMLMPASCAWAFSRPGTAARVCDDLAAYETAEVQGAPFQECITAASTGDAYGTSAKCVAIVDEAMKLMELKKHECLISLRRKSK